MRQIQNPGPILLNIERRGQPYKDEVMFALPKRIDVCAVAVAEAINPHPWPQPIPAWIKREYLPWRKGKRK